MLSYKELESIAELKRLPLINAEKDYLQEIVLFSIYSNLGRELVFKGGTCLYKIYKLDRFSEDLDFTLAGKVDIKKVAEKIIRDLELINIKGKVKEIKKYANQINVRLLFNGPLYKGSRETQCFILLNISLKEKIILEPKKEKITSFYKEISNFEVFAMHEQEILAEKIRAVMAREKPRDIYDLWFLLSKKNLSFNLKVINKKLKLCSLKFDLKKFIECLDKKENLWKLDLKNLIIGELPEFSLARRGILDALKGLKS